MKQFTLGMMLGPWIVTVALAALVLIGAIGFGYDNMGQVILVYGSIVFAAACTIAGALLWLVWRVVGLFRQ